MTLADRQKRKEGFTVAIKQDKEKFIPAETAERKAAAAAVDSVPGCSALAAEFVEQHSSSYPS